MPLDCDSEGEPRASLVPPPPAPAAAPCDADDRPAAEELEGAAADDTVFRERPDDSSWLKLCCCVPELEGEKTPGLEEDTEELRLAERRLAACAVADVDERGGKAERDGLLEAEGGRSRACDVELVETGGSGRPSCC
jgi:hypothetical protein